MSAGQRVQFLMARNGGALVMRGHVLRSGATLRVCCDDGRVRTVNRRTCVREVSYAPAA